MQDWKVSALPVLEGEGRVVGLVSEADLLPKEEFRHHRTFVPCAFRIGHTPSWAEPAWLPHARSHRSILWQQGLSGDEHGVGEGTFRCRAGPVGPSASGPAGQ